MNSKSSADPKSMTKAQLARVKDIGAAEEFIKKYYPGLWNRVSEDDLLHLLTIGHMLYKTNPEYLEATNQTRQTPTQ